MNRCIALLLASVSLPTLATAQDMGVSGAVTLGFGTHDVSDIDQDLQTTSLDGRIDIDFGNGFAMGVDGGYLDLSIDDVPVDFEAKFIGVDGRYAFANGFSMGAYYEDLTASADILPIDLSLDSWGVTAGYEIDDVDLGLFIGQSSTSPSLSPDIDFRDLGLTASYSGVENLALGAAFLRTTIKNPGDDVDVDFLGLAATYALNDQFSIFAGLSQSDLEILDADATTFGLGAGYNLPAMGGVNSTVSLELARTSLSAGGSDAGDLDTVRLGLTFPLGGNGGAAPLNSVADSILNPRHSAINTGLTAAF